MKTELYYYDIYPKMVKSGVETEICIKSLSPHTAFSDEDYLVEVLPLTHERLVVDTPPVFSAVKHPKNGVISFSHAFIGEQEHFVRLKKKEAPEKRIVSLSVYSLLPDLYERRPYMGDFHIHTSYSDGREAPAIVASMYRQAGFDFATITDHNMYMPSCEAVDTFQSLNLDFKIYHGEEVHTPRNNVHILNFGGDYSINALTKYTVTELWASDERPEWVYEVTEFSKTLKDIPEGIDPYIHASCLLAFKKIREAGGMCIFCHPHWIADIYNVADVFTRYYLENGFADAFELIGGQSSYENMMQLAMYQDVRSNGHKIPIVGNSDSHGTINAGLFNHMKTIVFAKANSRNDIIFAVKNGYSVAVNDYHKDDVNMFSTYRMVSYALFLYDHYFPIHNELCYEEGRLMRSFVAGATDAKDRLDLLKGQTVKLMEKYFGI